MCIGKVWDVLQQRRDGNDEALGELIFSFEWALATVIPIREKLMFFRRRWYRGMDCRAPKRHPFIRIFSFLCFGCLRSLVPKIECDAS